MVWVSLKNGSGQVVRGVKLHDPSSGVIWSVVKTRRLSINNYEITLEAGQDKILTTNHRIKNRYEVHGGFLSPEDLALIFKKYDPDANLPRPQRKSFWTMKSKPGTFNYEQKKRLMRDPFYIEKYGHLFEETLVENV